MTRNLISAFVVCISMPCHSCDVCGASNSISGFGTYANGNKTNFGLNYQFKTYKSSHPGIFNEHAESSTELFQRLELKGQFRLSKRWQGNADVPLVLNQQTHEGLRSKQQGFGDIGVGINYFIINRQDSLLRKVFRWNIGIGTKVPSGKYTHPDSSNLMLFPGSGSFDAVFNTILFYQKNKWSFVSESSFFLRGTNKFHYQAGNTFSSTLFANRKLRDFSSYLGAQFVWVGHAYRNTYIINNSPTVGSILTALCGITYRKNNWLFQGSYHLPLTQNLGNGYTKQKQAFNISLFYFI